MENCNILSEIDKDIPYEWTAQDDFSSHRPLVYWVLEHDKEKRPFVELGSGLSTRVFREYCNATNRKFESFDNSEEWCEISGATYIKDYEVIRVFMGCIMFIDCAPADIRKELIYQHRHNPILIIHDTEEGSDYVYGLKDILSTFTYRMDFKPEGQPQTTIVSNTKNFEEWK